MNDDAWDVIVIGGGLGGMLVAAILAGQGRRVVLLEREPHLGGRLRSYDVDGFVVDAGAYLWPDAYLSTALRAAGTTDFHASTIAANEIMRVFVEGLNGQRFAFPWPGRPPSPRMIVAAAATLRADPATYGALCALWDELAALGDDALGPLRRRPVGEVLPRFAGAPAVAEAFLRNLMLFGTADPKDAAFGDCVALRRRDPRAPIPLPECAGDNAAGGVRALVQALSRTLSARAADVRLGWRVEQIAVDGAGVTGVLAHGAAPFQTFLRAPVVISNLPIWTLFEVISPTLFSPEFVRAAASFSAVGGIVGAAFAFDGLPRLRESGEEDTFRGWTRLLVGSAAEFGGGLLWSSHHSPHNAPPGKHLLQAMRLTSHAEIADASRVSEIHSAFRRMLAEIYLDAREKLLWERTWVTRDGSEYLVCAAPRPPLRAPGLSGLYFVGETTDVPAVQMDAAALSALRVAEMVLQG